MTFQRMVFLSRAETQNHQKQLFNLPILLMGGLGSRVVDRICVFAKNAKTQNSQIGRKAV